LDSVLDRQEVARDHAPDAQRQDPRGHEQAEARRAEVPPEKRREFLDRIHFGEANILREKRMKAADVTTRVLAGGQETRLDETHP
jgi:hypothetical protein